MTDTAELKPVAWTNEANLRVMRQNEPLFYACIHHENTAEWNVPLYSADALSSLVRERDELAERVDRMHGAEELLTAQNIIVRAVWDVLGGEDPTRADGQNIVARVREVVAENEKMREALKLSIKIIGAVGKYIRAEDKLVRDKKREPMTSRDAADMASIRLLDFDARDCDEIIRRARASMSNTSEGGKGE